MKPVKQWTCDTSETLDSVCNHILKSIFNSLGWLASNLALQYYPWTKHEGHERKENDRQLQKLLTVRQSLLVSTLGDV